MARSIEDIIRVQIGGLTLEVAAQIARAEAAEEAVVELKKQLAEKESK